MIFYIRANAVRFYVQHLNLNSGADLTHFLGMPVVIVPDEKEE